MSWPYRPALDGLRMIAVYLVLLYHTGIDVTGNGFIGVDLFFILSGFLVSGVILSEIDATGGLRLGHFYARRVRRLLPAALVVVVSTCAVFLLVSPVTQRLAVIGDAQSSLLYVANWHFLHSAEDYFASNVNESPFLHFWSLAIEEQFYFVFPVLLVLLVRASKRRGKALATGIGALLALSLAAQLYWAQADPTHAYYGTDARLYQLLAGALLTIGFRARHWQVTRRTADLLALGGLAALLVLGSTLLDLSPSLRGIAATVSSVAIVAGLALREDGLLATQLTRQGPVFLGRISYGTYLWHWPVIIVLDQLLLVRPLVASVLTVGVATGLAALSYEIFERPIRTTALLNRFRWRAAVLGVSVSALVAVTAVPWILEQERRPAFAALEAAGAPGTVPGASPELPDNVDWQKVESGRGHQVDCTAEDPQACVTHVGSGPTVVLIGDSQALMLQPMFEELARDHDFTLAQNVSQGCPWQENLVNLEQSPHGLDRCERTRVGWFDTVLPELHPDVVVLISRPRDDSSWEGSVVFRDGQKAPVEQIVTQTSAETLEKITALGARAVLVQKLIVPETFDATDCLTTAPHAAQCAVPVPMGTSIFNAFTVSSAEQDPDVFSVDLNPAFCPGAPLCQAVVKDQVVWRDDHHITTAYAKSRSKAVWRLLEESGAFKGLDGRS